MKLVNEKNKTKTAKMRSRLRTLLELFILLFTLWLLLVLFLLFFSGEKEPTAQPLMKELTALTGMQMEDLEKVILFNEMRNITDESPDEGNGAEALLGSPERDDLEYSMEELLKERELLFQNAEALFEEVKLPEGAYHPHSAIERDSVNI